MAIHVNPVITAQIHLLQQLVPTHNNAAEIIQDLTHPNYQQFTDEQRFFFLLTKIYGTSIDYGESNVTFEWFRLLQIRAHLNFADWQELQIMNIINIAMNHGVICLHEPIVSLSPKLILGCGHGNPEDGFSHSHQDADTIDGALCANPTWVGEIGNSQNIDYWSSVLNGRYRTIMDEGAIGEYTIQIWKMIVNLLQPGGIFIAMAEYVNEVPEDCPLSYHTLTFTKGQAQYDIYTKALHDGTYSGIINSNDIPIDVRQSLPADLVISVDNVGIVPF